MSTIDRATIIRLATLNAVAQTSDSEEFYLASLILNSFGITVDKAIEQYEAQNNQAAWDGPTEEEVRENGITPIAITGPGWYKTASGEHAHIKEYDAILGHWNGIVRVGAMEYYDEWTPDGRDYEDYEKWMIVARIDD